MLNIDGKAVFLSLNRICRHPCPRKMVTYISHYAKYHKATVCLHQFWPTHQKECALLSFLVPLLPITVRGKQRSDVAISLIKIVIHNLIVFLQSCGLEFKRLFKVRTCDLAKGRVTYRWPKQDDLPPPAIRVISRILTKLIVFQSLF